MVNRFARPGWGWALTALGVCVSLVVALAVSATLARASAPGEDSSEGQYRGESGSGKVVGPDGKAKNVILLVGDGMGDSQITLARNYEKGAAGRFAMDALPNTGDMTTYSVEEDDPKVPDYVPDSAATGTAWSTGQKTSSGRLSTTASTDEDLTNINDLAQQAGMKTGNVSTAEITDATPAAPTSKVSSRDCKGPEDMEDCEDDRKANGGLGSIAEQQADGKTDVLLGGARDSYEQQVDAGPYEGSTVKESAAAQGYNVAQTADEMEAADPSQRLLGLFAGENLETRWSGKAAQKDLDFRKAEPQTCKEDNAPADQPDLASMTNKAIDGLETRDTKDNGFFLQVESASIDKKDHASNPCEQIGETVNMDNAVAEALAYAEKNPDTLVLTTADHGHTSTIVPGPSSEYFGEDDSFVPPGESSVLNTADGTEMMITYATNNFRDEKGKELEDGDSHTHTGTQVRLAGQGPGSENVLGLTDQTDLYTTMTGALGLNTEASAASGDAASGGAASGGAASGGAASGGAASGDDITMPDTGGPDPAGWLRNLLSGEDKGASKE